MAFFILGSVNFCKTFRRISEVWGNAQAQNVDKCLISLSSITSQICSFMHWIVFDLFFCCVTVKTIYNRALKDFSLLSFFGGKPFVTRSRRVTVQLHIFIPKLSVAPHNQLHQVKITSQMDRNNNNRKLPTFDVLISFSLFTPACACIHFVM